MSFYKCDVCKQIIPESDGITTLSGSWVCDADTCRTLDNENQAHEKARPALQCQTDRVEKLLTHSIPQTTLKLSIEMEPSEKRNPIGLDSFPLSTVRAFKLYLKAQRIFLDAGIIAP